jgi:hypothetical protein
LKSPLDQSGDFYILKNAEARFKVFSECKNQLSDEGAEQDFRSLSFPPQRITEATQEAKVNPLQEDLAQNSKTDSRFVIFPGQQN